MGAPSGCRVSAPVTCVAGESGALRSVAPCADQPTEEGEISNSSWPTVWPSSWMVNFPLSGAKTGAFFCACEATVLNARMHSARTPNVILDFKDLRLIEATPSAKLLLRAAAKYKVCHSGAAKRGYRARLRSECYRRVCSLEMSLTRRDGSRFRLFHDEVTIAGTGGDNASPENFGNDAGWFARAVHAVVGLLIGRQTLRVKGAKAGLVSKQRAAAHGHAAGQQNI